MVVRSRRCFQLSAFFKFVLFFSFTIVYCYFAYITLPSTKPTRPTITFATRNRTKHVKEQDRYDWTLVERDLNDRRLTLQEACLNAWPRLPPNAWEFVIDAHHNLVWCNVFKAASSSWMHNFNLLGGFAENFLRVSHKNPITLMRSRFPRPSVSQLLASWPTSLSFLIARDPLHRLLSAYRNKIERVHSQYYKRLARAIIVRFRGKLPKEDHIGPTFEEFVRYVTESHGRADEHWAPIYQFCTPCSLNFTVIAKMETLSRDQQYIINKAGISDILTPGRMQAQNRANEGPRTSELVAKYYSKLNRELVHRLVHMYTMDFEMFGYNSSQYYDMV
ncbi:carbohydrate sulfotransferase 11-like [Macrosteles quadrilineatus]|uniref:carbohydrate sulfotransferase 11-like n=1 Tax=Macrosteles quadrilineatus TaxID=74068 RepID=UPI0023E12439|nr:carbohydrate sulfotransferase 11-like [Macrosteles quadrilineatus]